MLTNSIDEDDKPEKPIGIEKNPIGIGSESDRHRIGKR